MARPKRLEFKLRARQGAAPQFCDGFPVAATVLLARQLQLFVRRRAASRDALLWLLQTAGCSSRGGRTASHSERTAGVALRSAARATRGRRGRYYNMPEVDSVITRRAHRPSELPVARGLAGRDSRMRRSTDRQADPGYRRTRAQSEPGPGGSSDA